MTSEEINKIKNKYQDLLKIKAEISDLMKKIDEYEQDPIVREYLKLKEQLESDKGYAYYSIVDSQDTEILEKAIKSVGVSNTNNIYVCMGTYQQNDEKNEEYSCDFNVPYDDPNADYREYINIEISEDEDNYIQLIPISECSTFEEKNIVLYPPKNVNSAVFFFAIRNMYFDTAIKYGGKKALEKILYRRNVQKKFQRNQRQELVLNEKDKCEETNQHPISELDHDVIPKIIELQGIILDKRQKSLSIEKMIKFLRSAMNYGKFQIWLLENQIDGLKLSINDKLKKFLEETSTDEILTLYDIEQNYEKEAFNEHMTDYFNENSDDDNVDEYYKLLNADRKRMTSYSDSIVCRGAITTKEMTDIIEEQGQVLKKTTK